jgi:hypothetical protein
MDRVKAYEKAYEATQRDEGNISYIKLINVVAKRQ